jgi:hypothetical protein
MLTRRKSLLARALDTVPLFAVAGVGVAAVFIAMNVLVTWAPISVASPSLSPSPGFTFPATPSILPVVTGTPFLTPAPSASVPATKPTIIKSAVSAADPQGAWKVYLAYPTFRAGTTPWADQMNADVGDEMQTRATQWESGPAANPRPGKLNTLYGSFVTDLLTPDLASFTVTWTDDSNPGTVQLGVETISYDLSSGQRLAFDDLFPDATSALATISLQTRSLLQDQLGAAYNPAIAEVGTSPTTSNFTNWALTIAGVKFVFPQYQVTDRADLQPAVVVPWEILKPVMVQSGPLASLAGF